MKREVSGWMRCFSRDRAEARGQQPLTTLVCPSLNGLEANARQRSDRAHKSRRPSSSLRESPRAQLQNEHPSRCKYKYLPHPHTAMHVKGTDKQADHCISTPGLMQAVRSNSDLLVRAWGAASTPGVWDRWTAAIGNGGTAPRRLPACTRIGTANALW